MINKRVLIISGVLTFIIGVGVGLFIWQGANKNSLSNASNENILKNSKEDILNSVENLSVVSFVTPHHLVAEELIDNIFSKVSEKNKGKKINRIILVSPNHFNIGHGKVIVADEDLEIEGEQTIKTDKTVGQALLNLNFVFGDKDAFYKEHGIRNILPFTQKYFPDVPVINLMIRDGVSADKMTILAKVTSNLPGNTLVILSSDFSHYLSQTVSNWHDKKAVDIISNFDYPAVYNLETDCLPGLFMLMKFSELQGTKKFTLVDNSNSSKIYKEDIIGQNTSYVTGYFSGDDSKDSKKGKRLASLLFLGDLMLDRHNRELIKQQGVGYFTNNVERLFWGQDLNIINLEGPITNNKSVSVGVGQEDPNHFKFTFDPKQTINFLQANRINLVNIGNNHILNFHNKGLEQTEKFLEDAKIDYFGDPLKISKMSVVKEVAGYKIGFVNYNQFAGFGVDDVLEIIQKLKTETDFIIVYPHWGREYELRASEAQRQKAYQFIDAGADLVIGAHPHVVQPVEIYKDKAIFYSLGNFVFDQYFSEDVKSILGLGISLNNKQIEFTLIPLYKENNGQLDFMKARQKKEFLQSLVERSIMNEVKKGKLKEGVVQLLNEN